MSTISIQDLERNLAGALGRVENGESLLVTKDGAPVAELRPTRRPESEPRPHGLAKGQFKVPDDFDDPLPEEILSDFEGS